MLLNTPLSEIFAVKMQLSGCFLMFAFTTHLKKTFPERSHVVMDSFVDTFDIPLAIELFGP